MRPRRTLLYVPGSDQHKIEKAAKLGADSVCMDLEDGVALVRKDEARRLVATALRTIDFGRSERLARINAVGSGLEPDDLDAVLPAHPDGIVVPKVTDARQVFWVSDQIGLAERSNRWPTGSIRLLVMIENARGVINLAQIAAADRRVDALIFGAEDYAADVGAIRTQEGREVLFARSTVVTTAAAFGLQAIDLLDIDFRDSNRLRAEATEGAHLGFAGKQIIHPNQIQPVEQAFTPSDQEIDYARRVVQAAEEAEARGTGAFALDDRMVDRPVILEAERVLTRARLVGKIK